jgi:hypothetical protein
MDESNVEYLEGITIFIEHSTTKGLGRDAHVPLVFILFCLLVTFVSLVMCRLWVKLLYWCVICAN